MADRRLPEWSRSERYDVHATGDPGVPKPTPVQRAAMVEGMLRDRFRLETHDEFRELSVYHLVLSRGDANNHLEGDVTVDVIASHVQGRLRQPVIDKTGLKGYFRVSFTAGFELQLTAATPGTTAEPPGAAPSIFTAVQEQLGLKLEAGRAPLRVLVIDRFERPSENQGCLPIPSWTAPFSCDDARQ